MADEKLFHDEEFFEDNSFEEEIEYEDQTSEIFEASEVPESEVPIKSFVRHFQEDVQNLAKKYITDFFDNKMMYCGGRIPKKRLFNDDAISMVINFDICRGVDYAYLALEKTLTKQEVNRAKIAGEITSDIKLVTEILNLLSRSGIPQQFAGGMMIMYLELVEGVQFGE